MLMVLLPKDRFLKKGVLIPFRVLIIYRKHLLLRKKRVALIHQSRSTNKMLGLEDFEVKGLGY